MTKKLENVRGPELVHNKLMHKQYGIIALAGGKLHFGHFEMIRNTINKNMDAKETFAIWRVDPPWSKFEKKDRIYHFRNNMSSHYLLNYFLRACYSPWSRQKVRWWQRWYRTL